MRQLNEHHTFTGMKKDLSTLTHPTSFLYDAKNIRITGRSDGTLMAITNEKGTLNTNITINGYYKGHCCLNKYLIIFSSALSIDYITKIDLEALTSEVLFSGNLKLGDNIQTIGSYENDKIQKVYWTDGINQPRVINIMGIIKEGDTGQFDFVRSLKLEETVSIQKKLGTSGSFAPGVIQYMFTYFNKYRQESNIFYTSPLLYISHGDRGAAPDSKVENSFLISLKNLDPNFEYLRIYSLQRTSLNDTPIARIVADIDIRNADTTTVESKAAFIGIEDINKLYIVDDNNVKTKVLDLPRDTTNQAWWLNENAKYTFLYEKRKIVAAAGYFPAVMLYNSARFPSSINGRYQYYIVNRGALSNTHIFNLSMLFDVTLYNDITFTDNGIIGSSIEPASLLYKGGEPIKVVSMVQKDNTLFLGNISFDRKNVRELNIDTSLITLTDTTRNIYVPTASDIYKYSNQLNAYSNAERTISVPCSGFKAHDYYRCGIQFQHVSGKWSEPIFLRDKLIGEKPSVGQNYITLPAIKGTIPSSIVNTLLANNYKKARAIVVMPEMQDRNVLCQGVLSSSLYTSNHRTTNGDLYGQSSWLFRGNVALPYNDENLREVEIQGDYNAENCFVVDSNLTTLHSPDLIFDDWSESYNFDGVNVNKVGHATFNNTLSAVRIQTSTPTVSSRGGGITEVSYKKTAYTGIKSGLFYDDFLVDDVDNTFKAYRIEKSPVKWLVYMWHRNGSLNNDFNRPSDKGTRTGQLLKKAISNLRISSTTFDNSVTELSLSETPQLFSSDQVSIIKLGDNVYEGNIDTLLYSDREYSNYFAFNSNNIKDDIATSGIITSIDTAINYKLGSVVDGNNNTVKGGILKRNGNTWSSVSSYIGDSDTNVAVSKEPVRMRYKSTPHLVCKFSSPALQGTNITLPIVEVCKQVTSAERFGGTSEDALKNNKWIPCGEPILLKENIDAEYEYSYGDTYYQRFDCLKTYAFSTDDINQVIEIGSFMLETRINIDGRYDRNRGQLDNTNMSPINFNLINPVYSQLDNFFTYRILDSDYYKMQSFPNQFTWTTEKLPGADIDEWTHITLASTYDVDGTKGKINALCSWKNILYCFQDKGISNILFNSRVQIPTSDNNPIEITNSYKVDGVRYISDGIGCKSYLYTCATPSGIYFIDSIGGHLYHVSEQLKDIATTGAMTSWYETNSNNINYLLYDAFNHDVYTALDDTTLCFSEILGQFTSFYDYQEINLIETYDSHVFTLHDHTLYKMFEGEYNDFFPEKNHNYKDWELTFISNGSDSNTQDISKIFSNIDYRMDVHDNDNYQGRDTFNSIRVWNDYQDTGEVSLNSKFIPSNLLQKKFAIWRIQIPRNNNSLDRIVNTWCKIKLSNKHFDNHKSVLHDINVQYFIQ